MTLSLIESAKLAAGGGVDLNTTVTEIFANEHPLIGAMQFMDIPGNAYAFTREMNLPPSAFRGINGAYTPSTGNIDKVTESLSIVGGDIDVDKFLVDTHGANTRASHVAQKVKAIAHKVGYSLIKGDQKTSPQEFDGLQARCDNFSRVTDAGSTSGGDALSLGKLDELIDGVSSGTHLIMSQAMRRLLTAASRLQSVGGHILFQQNEMGRQVASYNGLPILEVDGNRIAEDALGFNEPAPVGGQLQTTSIYCVNLGSNGLVGLQRGGIQVRDLGEVDDSPVFRTRVEWFLGMADMDVFSIRRLRGIANAAVTA